MTPQEPPLNIARQAFEESEVQATLKQVAKFLNAHGDPHFDTKPQTAAWAGHQTQIHAALPAHIDLVWMLVLITVPLVLMLRKVKAFRRSAWERSGGLPFCESRASSYGLVSKN